MIFIRCCLDVLVIVCLLGTSVATGATGSSSTTTAITNSSCTMCPGPAGSTITYAHMDAVGSVGRVTVLFNMTITKGPYQPINYFMVRSDTWFKNHIGAGQIIVKTSASPKLCPSAGTTRPLPQVLVRGQRCILFGSIQDEVVPDYADLLPVFTVDHCRPQKIPSTLSHGEWDTLLRYSPAPSAMPTSAPSETPLASPTTTPTSTPTLAPSTTPTTAPSTNPVSSPSHTPTEAPSMTPTTTPTMSKSVAPSSAPTMAPDSFQIYLDVTAKISTTDKRFFQIAANRWQSVIRTGHAAVNSTVLGAPPLGCKFPATIDDLYLCATYDHFASDGPGKFIGFALPVYWRKSTYTPLAGFISLDSADIATLKSRGLFTRTILHELGHVLGIGTQWERTKLTGTIEDGCPYFGPKANAEYKSLTGCDSVATELDGGVGTHCQHWDEMCLGDELMTGYLGGRTQLSRLTIAGLEDLGYEVNYANSDYLGTDDINPKCMCKTRRELWDELPQREQEQPQQQTRHLRHGDVTLLHHAPSEHRRKLSDDGYDQALATGHSILEKLHQQLGGATSSSDVYEFAGDRVVSILMMEGDDIFGVLVERKDPMP